MLLGKRVSRWAAGIPGLTPFWSSAKRSLLSICKRHCPNAFVTFSAADTYWSDLHRLIEHQRAIASGGPILDLATLSVAEAHHRRVQNLVDYPQIAASYHQRISSNRGR